MGRQAELRELEAIAKAAAELVERVNATGRLRYDDGSKLQQLVDLEVALIINNWPLPITRHSETPSALDQPLAGR